jgi:hypothetical protein
MWYFKPMCHKKDFVAMCALIGGILLRGGNRVKHKNGINPILKDIVRNVISQFKRVNIDATHAKKN